MLWILRLLMYNIYVFKKKASGKTDHPVACLWKAWVGIFHSDSIGSLLHLQTSDRGSISKPSSLGSWKVSKMEEYVTFDSGIKQVDVCIKRYMSISNVSWSCHCCKINMFSKRYWVRFQFRCNCIYHANSSISSATAATTTTIWDWQWNFGRKWNVMKHSSLWATTPKTPMTTTSSQSSRQAFWIDVAWQKQLADIQPLSFLCLENFVRKPVAKCYLHNLLIVKPAKHWFL